MLVKYFESVNQPVNDPLHPTRTVFSRRLRAVNQEVYRHVVQHYDKSRNQWVVERIDDYLPADDDGWFNVPPDVAAHMKSFRPNGTGWYEEGEVADAVRLDRMAVPNEPVRPKKADEPAKRGPGRPRKVEADAE